MMISLIIPTLNEAQNIIRLVQCIKQNRNGKNCEIIVVDGGSTDETVAKAESAGVRVLSSPQGRAIQMNLGAANATGDVLYFVHSDTLPPNDFISDIEQAIAEQYDMGCYRFKFDSKKQLLKINGFFTRFSSMWSRGGDQSLFVKKDVFDALNGYDEKYVIMEEYDFLRRARLQKYRFKLMQKDILVSARKYDDNSYLRVQVANLVVYNMFRYGYEPQRILSTYRRLIDYRS
ncbi:MAG: glycosyltransferase family 2 protein [Saprospiraceae bacterium]|nr:glycosyltransferase family 2 protein [Saprospiraceae bacterium]